MKVVDLNLLLYASNRDAPEHEKASSWWKSALSAEEPVGLAWIVILGYLRITTRPGPFPRPLTHRQALDDVGDWIERRNVVLLHPGERHWSVLRSLIEQVGTAGNLTTDAHLAALAVEYSATLYSTDNDYARFRPTLRFVNPIT